MAEFMDVIRTVQRICKRRNGKCQTCILGEFACPNNVRFYATDKARFWEFEDVVIKWAEENPEPVYPTWFEYLYAINNPDYFDLTEFYTWMRHTHIPADIAEKLGIEPKER